MSLLHNLNTPRGGKGNNAGYDACFTDEADSHAGKRRRTSDGDSTTNDASSKRRRTSTRDVSKKRRRTSAGKNSGNGGCCSDDANSHARKRRCPTDGDSSTNDAITKRRRTSTSDASKKRRRTSDSVDGMPGSSSKRQRTSAAPSGKRSSTARRKVPAHDGGKQATDTNKRPPPSKSSRQQASKTRSAAGDDTLRLVLEPPATPVRRRRRLTGRHLDMQGRTARGSVNGHDCNLVLDCGSAINVALFSTAKKLGLITGQERTETLRIVLWRGLKELKVIMLDKVAVTLGRKVQIHVPLLVWPASMEKHYSSLRDVLLLGIPVLRRLNAVQTFAADGSRLYIRLPRCLKACVWRWRGCWQTRKMYTFRVRRLQDRRQLRQVIVDTGATGFYISKTTRADITRRQARPPRRVSLDLGGGSCLEAEPLLKGPPTTEFLFGIKVLTEYEAVLDYGKYSLTLTVGGRRLKVTLGAK